MPVKGERINISAPSIMDTSAPHAQHAVRREFCLQHKQHQRKSDQRHPGEIDGKKMHRKKRQQKRDPAQHPGSEQPRMRELHIQPSTPRISRMKNTSGCTMRERNFSRPFISIGTRTGCGSVELCRRSVEARDGAPVELGKQVFGRVGDEVDQLAVERLLFA